MNIYHKSAITPLLVELFFQQKPFGSNLAWKKFLLSHENLTIGAKPFS